MPRSKPILANLTAIGSSVASQGVLLRRGTGVEIYNSVFTGFGDSCVKFDGAATFINAGSPGAATGELVIENSFFDCGVNFSDGNGATFSTADFINAMAGNVEGNPSLDGMYPSAFSPLTSSAKPVADTFIENVNYSGAFRDFNDRWADEWTFGL